MGELNMNQLHLRISDDEGWRIQILQLPELTNIGANRCYDPNVKYFSSTRRVLHGPQSIRSHIMWSIYFSAPNTYKAVNLSDFRVIDALRHNLVQGQTRMDKEIRALAI